MEFKKAGFSVFVSWIEANKTGLLAKATNPNKINDGIINIPSLKEKIIITTGIEKLINNNVFRRPILSERCPDVIDPTAPANCNIDRDIPPNQRLPPLALI